MVSSLVSLALASAVSAVATADAPPTVLPSPGCSAAQRNVFSGGPNNLTKYTVDVDDFEPIERVFWLQNPGQLAGDAATAPAPLLFSFHGQTEEAQSFGMSHNWTLLGADHGLIAVFPQGMNDSYPGEEQGTGWNVGSAGDLGNATCVAAGVGSNGGCYKSCRKLGKCGRCNWSTCYDDVKFVRAILKRVIDEFCIDLNRVYIHGESNGGMVTNYLVREMPDVFAAMAPWFGSPMIGFLLGENFQMITHHADIAKTALLTLHARQDITIPPGGGLTGDGWMYEPEHQNRGLWTTLHGCDLARTPLATKWDGGPLDFRCTEHQNCQSGRRVIGCMYNGSHGDWPTGTGGDEISLWFFFQFSRGQQSEKASLKLLI